MWHVPQAMSGNECVDRIAALIGRTSSLVIIELGFSAPDPDNATSTLTDVRQHLRAAARGHHIEPENQQLWCDVQR